MEERVFSSTPGAILEGFGRLLSTDVTIYVAPMHRKDLAAALGRMPDEILQESAGELVTLDDFRPKPPLDQLFRYLRDAGHIVPLEATTQPKS
jgi:hypothetical protein